MLRRVFSVPSYCSDDFPAKDFQEYIENFLQNTFQTNKRIFIY
jgi:hypothetical protein